MPTCLAPSSVQQKFQFSRPIGITGSFVSVPAPTGWRCSLTIGMRLVHEAPEERELGA